MRRSTTHHGVVCAEDTDVVKIVWSDISYIAAGDPRFRYFLARKVGQKWPEQPYAQLCNPLQYGGFYGVKIVNEIRSK